MRDISGKSIRVLHYTSGCGSLYSTVFDSEFHFIRTQGQVKLNVYEYNTQRDILLDYTRRKTQIRLIMNTDYATILLVWSQY
jgi:coproporphyrinogen III oxidase